MSSNQDQKNVSIVSSDDVRTESKQLHYWPYCETCRTPFVFDPDEPFAYCICGTTEWGNPRPAPWVPDPGNRKKGHDWTIAAKSPSGIFINEITTSTHGLAAMLAIASTAKGSDKRWPSYRPVVEVTNTQFEEKICLFSTDQNLVEICVCFNSIEYSVEDIENAGEGEFSPGLATFVGSLRDMIESSVPSGI